MDVGIQFQFASLRSRLAEDVGTVLIGVVRGDDANIPVTVDFGTSDVTATNGVDYIGFTNNALVCAHRAAQVRPRHDPQRQREGGGEQDLPRDVVQPGRRFAGNYQDDHGHDHGQRPRLSFESANYYVAEDAGVALIGVLRGTDDTNSAVTVDFATADNSAINGLDYTGLTNTLSFAPGERRKVVPVPILNDGIKEGLEDFQADLEQSDRWRRAGRSDHHHR